MNNFPDDRQRGPLITGWAGVRVREFFVRYLAALPLLERRWPGFFCWLGKNRSMSEQTMPRNAGMQAPADR
jgi:hypothetical protein